MEMQLKKKITWTIKNPSSLLSEETCYSDIYSVGGCRWRLSVFRNIGETLTMHLELPDYEFLPSGVKVDASCLLTIVNQPPLTPFIQNEQYWWGFSKYNSRKFCGASVLSLHEMLVKDSGFLVDGELKIVGEIEVLQVTGNFDASEKSSTTTDDDDFQDLSSEVEIVSRMFERHPEIASIFNLKDTDFRTAYNTLLLNLIETLSESPRELHKDDLCKGYAALRSMGFKLDWLKKKFYENLDKKERQEYGEIRIQLEQELKLKCSHLESHMEKKKVELSAAKE